MSIDLVLFDLDDILVGHRPEVRCRTLAERPGVLGLHCRDHASLRLALSTHGLLENPVHAF